MGCPHLKKKRLIGKHCLCTATNPEHEIQSTVFLNSICQKTEEQWKTCSYFTEKYKEIQPISTESETEAESEIVIKYKKLFSKYGDLAIGEPIPKLGVIKPTSSSKTIMDGSKFTMLITNVELLPNDIHMQIDIKIENDTLVGVNISKELCIIDTPHHPSYYDKYFVEEATVVLGNYAKILISRSPDKPIDLTDMKNAIIIAPEIR